MRKLFYLLLSVSVLATTACNKDDDNGGGPPPADSEVIIIDKPITQSTTWDATKKYLLKGNIFVQAPAELTIPAGTVIMGDKATKGALIINRGAKIHAHGEPNKPVIFTSSAPAGFRNRGDWGGLVILGKARNNASVNATIEGITPATGGSEDGVYGGSEDADHSGEVYYARIEFAGIALSPNNELNSLTMGSVGSSTQIHHIMVSYGGDDSFEWFGGNVDHKYLVSYHGWDDDFDTDRGYAGRIQYALVIRDASNADNSGSNAFEASSANNQGTAPISHPKFANVTVLGPNVFSPGNINANFKSIVDANKWTNLEIYNSVLGGFATGFRYNSEDDFDAANNIFFTVSKNGTPVAFEETSGTPSANSTNTNSATVAIDALYGVGSMDISNPTVALAGSSAYKSGAPALPAGFENANFYGAFSDNVNTADWNFTSGWINFDPINAQY